jgi:hypothetical protein
MGSVERVTILDGFVGHSETDPLPTFGGRSASGLPDTCSESPRSRIQHIVQALAVGNRHYVGGRSTLSSSSRANTSWTTRSQRTPMKGNAFFPPVPARSKPEFRASTDGCLSGGTPRLFLLKGISTHRARFVDAPVPTFHRRVPSRGCPPVVSVERYFSHRARRG